jgi:hypothetical protein
MSRFVKVLRRIRKMQRELKTQEAEQTLDAPAINALRLQYEATGELPGNELQASLVLYLSRMHEAMMSTIPASNDGGKHYEECQQAMREAAEAHNAACERAGLTRRVSTGLP